MEAKIIKNRG